MRVTEAGDKIALRGIIYTNTPKENITAECKKIFPRKCKHMHILHLVNIQLRYIKISSAIRYYFNCRQARETV